MKAINWLHESRLALKAVKDSGNILSEEIGITKLANKETERDLVTEYDLQIQTLICKILSETAYPILSEELSTTQQAAISREDLFWVIDPIDGTVNFVYQMPLYAVSVALMRQKQLIIGAVSLPALNELYFMRGDEGAYLNGKRLYLPKPCPLKKSLVAATFSSIKDSATRSDEYKLFGILNDSSRGCLRLGSAAASICFVLAQRANCAYGLNVKIWDIAGALAIAKHLEYSVYFEIQPNNNAHFIVGSKLAVDNILSLMQKMKLVSKQEGALCETYQF